MQESLKYFGTMAQSLVSPPARRGSVVMFHDGRSGSTVLGDLFNQHPAVFWDSEIFMPNRLHPLPAGAAHYLMRHPLRLIKARRMRTDRPFYGFEAKFAQVERIGFTLDAFLSGLRSLDFRHYILLQRKNSLRRIISDAVSRNRRERNYHIAREEQPQLASVSIDVESLTFYGRTMPLTDHLRAYEAQLERTRELLEGENLLLLTYEDDIAQDPRLAFERVCRFLGLEARDVQVHYSKTNPFPVRDLVDNFGDVARALAGTEFEWMLYD